MQAAEFLNSIGVAAFALKYRLPGEKDSPYSLENVRQDAYRAMRLVRNRAAECRSTPTASACWDFLPEARSPSSSLNSPGDGDSSAADPIDRLNGRPDFQMLVYPGGQVPEKIPATSPPAFLIVANDDD